MKFCEYGPGTQKELSWEGFKNLSPFLHPIIWKGKSTEAIKK
jgi:hypothetical protein